MFLSASGHPTVWARQRPRGVLHLFMDSTPHGRRCYTAVHLIKIKTEPLFAQICSD